MDRQEAVATMSGQAVRIARPNGPLAIEKIDLPPLQGDQILVKVSACGVCHSDSLAVEGHYPGLNYPIGLGHEIAGTVDAKGPDAVRLKVGDRIGVGWHGWHCGHCEACRSEDTISCLNMKVPGFTLNGGFAQYAIFSESVCASIPDGLSDFDAAPMMCAGVSVFNALRHSGANAGDTVGILGIGGLGHLAVQFAKKMGFYTVAIARGKDKATLATELGADLYLDSSSDDAVASLKASGGAKVILATASSSKAISPWIGALAIAGKLVLVGIDSEPIQFLPLQLIKGHRSIMGWPGGTPKDAEECMQFAARFGVRPMVEKYSFENVSAGYERMMSGKARFRVVVEVAGK
ncbi:MAG TPA: alcohol dehydrogenase catalytic domain-containing protein [Planktothrix sp.]|jgi:D-arabinose 1-dehydrogenase-like Zn-dependent alcohol dehydrogenase